VETFIQGGTDPKIDAQKRLTDEGAPFLGGGGTPPEGMFCVHFQISGAIPGNLVRDRNTNNFKPLEGRSPERTSWGGTGDKSDSKTFPSGDIIKRGGIFQERAKKESYTASSSSPLQNYQKDPSAQKNYARPQERRGREIGHL